MLVVFAVFFRADRQRVDIGDIRRDNEEHRGSSMNPEPASDIDLDMDFDQDLL